jgi:phospholipid transport system substrate-binding protein
MTRPRQPIDRENEIRMSKRRQFISLGAGLVLLYGWTSGRRAQAASSETAASRATAFFKDFGDKLVAVVNGPGSTQDKRRMVPLIIDSAVDVDGVARFCLGRFWRVASLQQQKRYVELFHQVMLSNIMAKLGEFHGVKFTVGHSHREDEEEIVSSVVERPNNPPANVDWVISDPDSNPKIIDVVAEGTSFRLTQRSDYASYLAHNNDSIDALINALQQQAVQN